MWIDKQTFIDNLNLPNMTMTLTKCQVIRLYCADQGRFNWIPLIARTFNGWSSSPGNFNSGWSVPASHWSPRGLQRQLQLLLVLPQLPLLDDHTDHQRDSNYYYYCLMISSYIALITKETKTTTTTTNTITASIWWSVSVPISHWSQQWVANTPAGRRRCVRNFPHSCVSANLICAKVGNCVCIKRVGLSHKNIVIFSQMSANTSNSLEDIQVLSKIIVSGSRWLSC